MNVVESALRRIAADLDARAAGWALVGGFAVSIRSEPRFTRDVDVAIAVPGDPDAEALVRSLMDAGYRVLASVEQDAVDRLATARLALPGGAESGAIVDLLFASSGIEPELLAVAGGGDLGDARVAVGLIEARGYHRDRDLTAALAALTGSG